jgi:hypothetical protein
VGRPTAAALAHALPHLGAARAGAAPTRSATQHAPRAADRLDTARPLFQGGARRRGLQLHDPMSLRWAPGVGGGAMTSANSTWRRAVCARSAAARTAARSAPCPPEPGRLADRHPRPLNGAGGDRIGSTGNRRRRLATRRRPGAQGSDVERGVGVPGSGHRRVGLQPRSRHEHRGADRPPRSAREVPDPPYGGAVASDRAALRHSGDPGATGRGLVQADSLRCDVPEILHGDRDLHPIPDARARASAW